MATISKGVFGTIKGNVGGLNFATMRKNGYIKSAVFEKKKGVSPKQAEVLAKFKFIRQNIVPITPTLNLWRSKLNHKAGGQQYFVKQNYKNLYSPSPDVITYYFDKLKFFDGGYSQTNPYKIIYIGPAPDEYAFDFFNNDFIRFFKGYDIFDFVMFNETRNQWFFDTGVLIDIYISESFTLPYQWASGDVVQSYVLLYKGDYKDYSIIQYRFLSL